MPEPIKWIRTVVIAAEDVGASVRQLTLADPDGWELPPFTPGAHIDVLIGDSMVRTYSLVNPPHENTRYTIGVKREPHGRGGSRILHDHVAIGDELGVSLPRGGWNIDQFSMFRLVAGGIGLTPMLSVVSSLRHIGCENISLHVITRNATLYQAALAPLVHRGLAVVHDTSMRPRPDLADLVADERPETLAACCGPPAMLDAFERATMGWDEEHTHVERFTAPRPPVDDAQHAYVAVLADSSRQVDVPAGVSLLAALRAAGADVPSSCEGGVCGACRVGWMDGEPVHRDYVLSATEQQHWLLSCVSGCRTDKLVLDL